MSDQDPTDILNWRRIDTRITTSGQPDAGQLCRLANSGVQVIINLAPFDNKNAMRDEAEQVAKTGMSYFHIPVDFDAPSDADFTAFCNALAEYPNDRIHIHCIYNARVSAFMLRFAQEGYREDVDEIRAMMDTIWRPGAKWATFLGHEAAADQPNLYAGYEY